MNSDDFSTNTTNSRLAFPELIESRRKWIEDVLRPWCQTASRRELRIAEAEWTDLAGKAAPEKTLWFWAWSRFPDLCHHELCEINETWLLQIVLRDGTSRIGFPNARDSKHGELSLISSDGHSLDPLSIDEIELVRRLPLEDE